MKKLEDVISKWKFEWNSNKFDVAYFLDANQIRKFLGDDLFFNFKNDICINFDEKIWKPMPFSCENILNELKYAVEYGYKLSNIEHPGNPIIAFESVMLWNWVLEEGLENWDVKNYKPYGVPLFKATAEKYGWVLSFDTIIKYHVK